MLDTANDNQEAKNAIAEDEDGSSSSSRSDSSSSDDDDDNRIKQKLRKNGHKLSAALTGGKSDDYHNEEDDGKRGRWISSRITKLIAISSIGGTVGSCNGRLVHLVTYFLILFALSRVSASGA